MKYDLEERTAVFGENIIEFLQKIPSNSLTTPLITQLIKSSTSIGANYMEANHASSKKDFRNKIAICTKEANETKHWLRMISKAAPQHIEKCRNLWKEAHELTLIFATIKKNSLEKSTI